MAGPLDGILVVSLEQAVAAPYASRLLADAGARVIKVERHEGDFARGYDQAACGHSSYFVWLNRGKESIALDLKHGGDRAILDAMIARADVLIQNLGPGAALRLGLDPAELRERYPRLVTCWLSGFGEDGAYARRKAYDLVIQAESGLAAVTGGPEAPGRVGISICDIAAGATAYSAVLESLLARERSGRGEAVQVALFDVIAEWMSVPYLHARYGDGPPARVGLAHPSIAPYGVFETSDGPLLVAVQNEREWRRFCGIVLENPALSDDARFATNVARVRNRHELDELIAARFRGISRKEAESLLQEADIVHGAVNDASDLVAHPQVRTENVPVPGGTIQLPARPVRWRPASAAPKPVPELDEHGEAIRTEFANSNRGENA